MRILAIKTPWTEKVVTGHKTWEIRSRRTNIHHERVAIYATMTKPKQAHIDWLESIGHGTNDMIQGHIIGTVVMCGCQPLYNQEWFDQNVDKHLCPPELYKEGNYSWQLHSARRFKPIPYKMKKGAIVWDSVHDNRIPEAI